MIIISIKPSDHCLEWNIFSKQYIIRKLLKLLTHWWPWLNDHFIERTVPISQYIY